MPLWRVGWRLGNPGVCPRHLRRSADQLATAQRALSRCKRGSNRRQKVRARVAAIHALGRELDAVRGYLQLAQARFGRRLRVDVADALHGMPVAPLRVLTAVRTVVQRDIEPRPQGGVLTVSARADRRRVRGPGRRRGRRTDGDPARGAVTTPSIGGRAGP